MSVNPFLFVLLTLLPTPSIAKKGGSTVGGPLNGGGGSNGWDSTSGGSGSNGWDPTSGRENPSVSVEVGVALQFAEPIEIAVFSFSAVFSAITLYQTFILVMRQLYTRQRERPTAPLTQVPLPGERKPGLLFTVTLTFASLSLLAYWILSAVFEALSTSSRIPLVPNFTHDFYACLEWTYRLADAILLAALLVLLHRRARELPSAPRFLKCNLKTIFDGGILAAAVAFLGLVADSTMARIVSEYAPRRVPITDLEGYMRFAHLYAACELVLAIDVFVTSFVLMDVLRRKDTDDPIIRTAATRVGPLLVVLALFHLTPPILEDALFLRGANISLTALRLCDTLIYGWCMVFIMFYCIGMGHPVEKTNGDAEGHTSGGGKSVTCQVSFVPTFSLF